LTDLQKQAMTPHRAIVGETYKTLDWLRDSNTILTGPIKIQKKGNQLTLYFQWPAG